MNCISRFLKIIVLLSSLGSTLPVMPLSAAPPVNVIFDTDMSGDCDDVGALAVLNKLADAGEAKILACVANGHDQDKAVAASIDAVNTYYGRPHVPIGTYQGPKYGASKSPYTAALRDEFPHTALPDDQMPKAVDVYRKTLAAAHDGSVTIVSVGFLINLADLLQSPADKISPLTGVELVREKVKQLVVMGGHFPKGDGAEYNFGNSDGGPNTQYAVENWPTPILFSGFEIGGSIGTGKVLKDAPSSPVRRAYELYTKFEGRQSWDLTAALAAVRDPNLYWTIQSNGYCRVNADGTSEWTPTPNRGHSYLVAKVPPADVAKVLDDLMLLPPKTK
jgi:hypothetical protein